LVASLSLGPAGVNICQNGTSAGHFAKGGGLESRGKSGLIEDRESETFSGMAATASCKAEESANNNKTKERRGGY